MLEPERPPNISEEILERIRSEVRLEISDFEKRIDQLLSICRWFSGVAASLIVVVAALGWMLIDQRAPSHAREEVVQLRVYSCDALEHGVGAIRRVVNTELMQLEGQITRAQRTVSQQREQIAETDTELRALTSQKDELERTRQDLAKQLESPNTLSKDDLQLRYTNVRSDIDNKAAEIFRARDSKDRMAQQLEDAENSIPGLSADIRQLREEYAEYSMATSDCKNN